MLVYAPVGIQVVNFTVYLIYTEQEFFSTTYEVAPDNINTNPFNRLTYIKESRQVRKQPCEMTLDELRQFCGHLSGYPYDHWVNADRSSLEAYIIKRFRALNAEKALVSN